LNDTPLKIASRLGAYRFASLILTQKTSINIQANTLKLVFDLLKNGTVVNARTKEENSPMHIAVQLNNTEIGRALKKNRFINTTITI
jgi:hypothetical protein